MRTPAEVLDQCHRAGAQRIAGFLLSGHAFDRMRDRRLKRQEVARALVEATVAVAQDDGTWRVDGGSDLDGEPVTLIVALDRGVLIVTIF